MISVFQSVEIDGVDQGVGIDIAEDAIEHDHRDRDHGQADGDADLAQPDLAVEEARVTAQRLQKTAFGAGGLGIHQEFSLRVIAQASGPSPIGHRSA